MRFVFSLFSSGSSHVSVLLAVDTPDWIPEFFQLAQKEFDLAFRTSCDEDYDLYLYIFIHIYNSTGQRLLLYVTC